ncbi:LOW QUALITY PROTEIN: up-regulator of cell proliferation-like [Etheostoma cragini]|uniref:LOW QUALITY PROTEIN: up-regulator of cell proliferation-like n=1 Tax=Etheostoma cragini TaxID=417921 RepID=UPI00155EF2C0|nr:LOW QUALITY PROTEIN: up-regulator of cell proliferation-like [Etheostoma cragini]
MKTEGQEPAVLRNFLSKVGLEKYYPNKLTLRSLLEINKNSTNEEAVSSVENIPWGFLRKLFKLNSECRSCTQLTDKEDHDDNNDDYYYDDDDLYTADDPAENKKVNPLDLIVALFLYADSFLQQELALKMSMCQFSVPLLLPHANNSQSTLMLWALRDIVKEWRPHDLSESKGFVEKNIIQADLPFYSFVRLRNCSLSKSQWLNHVLSFGQSNNNIFIHRDMKGGAIKRNIANGLVEVCWYLPSGTENLNIFPEPVAFANLRGDVCESLAQFTFLFQVSTATFVFLDKVEEEEHKILTSLQDVKSKLFFVVNHKEGNVTEDKVSVKKTLKELELPKTSVKVKDPRVNVAEFSNKLCAAIKASIKDVKNPQSIANMLDKAVELGLSVDERTSDDQRKAAEEIVKGIGVRRVPDYKKQQLPLQGDNWKRLSKLEKEECRMKDTGDSGLEEYKTLLQAEKLNIREWQSKQTLSKGFKSFIEILSTSDKEKRDYFLKWMTLKLNSHSRDKLTDLRNKFKEQCKTKDAKLTAELDQALLESSLGIEHYMREMGLIYEFSFQSPNTADEISRLPGLAAEMLLDGYPLELLDGDVSNIPERWVTDVLMELHKKVGEKSRLLVLTVLGVQSSGKSTLLNTMFGVQFPVSSGRCTRGAYMLFLRVSEDIQKDLNCDFILLIDTEGLKSSDLAQLEDSYEHDNQLATFVIGLSDVTIINIAMENSTEMKDILQIATHAFLRMKEIGKKPVCHFVHQNVSAVSAHTKNLTDRKHLLDQLNEMTQIAAEMEKKPGIKAFSDVLDYDIEKNNWNIPGLWHGTPPMAPVNTGYSEAVASLKKNLLETWKEDKHDGVSQIPEFLEWMKSLWKAVKFENFIFSFRNTLVAHAYDNLDKEFSEWEWEFRKEILSWQTAAELEIKNADNESQVEIWNELVESKKSEVLKKIAAQQNIMKEKLTNYYKRKDTRVHLIEKYKVDFLKRINSLANEVEHSAYIYLDNALKLKIGLKEAQDIQRKSRGVIEERVMKLLSHCKNTTPPEERLTHEFENMWAEATKNIPHLPERDIPARILEQLRKHFSNQNVNEKLQNVNNLKKCGLGKFKTTRDHTDGLLKKVKYWWVSGDLQSFADRVIEISTQFVLDKTKTNGDYHDSFTKELLEKIDEKIEQNYKQYKTNSQFEIDLKLHICGIASREFLKMHRKFMSNNNPRSQLEKYKNQYLLDFIDLYKQRDDCQRKANDFVRLCVKPAVEEYISRSLGIDIVDQILTSCHSAEYSSRSFFQYNIQGELLQKGEFENFLKYICTYEIYVKDWIFQHILQNMSEDKTLGKLKSKNLQVIVNKITEATEQALKGEDGVLLPDNKESITKLINNMRKYLIKDISMSEEPEKATLFQIQSTCRPFTKSLFKALGELKEQLQNQFSNSEDITETLNKLPIKPQDELFKRVFGCGQQCPFCKVPCEAGGKDHDKHHAAVHRPQGLGSYRDEDTEKLVETLCTTDVHSDRLFQNAVTKQEWHPYKDYMQYYPDWLIPPDNTIEASDYWKYVLVQYNEQFAVEYKAKPADVPKAWRSITKEQELKGLKDAFNIK